MSTYEDWVYRSFKLMKSPKMLNIDDQYLSMKLARFS
jgi:hypothetical protein